MTNPHGTPIWYELLSNDADASTRFYEEVIGWKVHPPRAGDAMDYRMFDTGNGLLGGLLQLTPKMREGGARPTWLFYVGVDDVDATVAKAKGEGATVLMEPFDMEGVGRMAMIADPQGIPLYVMRGASPENSTVFERTGMGKCNWNELSTPDIAAGRRFYEAVFGWTYPDKMPMPDGGDYVFIDAAGTTIGAVMQEERGKTTGWLFYFRTPDIEATAAKVVEAGGKVHAGPMDVPGGDRVIVATDAHGVRFGAVGPGNARPSALAE